VLVCRALAVADALRAKARRTDVRQTFGVGRAHSVVAEVVDAVPEEVAVFVRRALVVANALRAKARRTDVGQAFGIGRTHSVVAEIVDAIAQEVAVFVRRALVVAAAFTAYAQRADTARTRVARTATTPLLERPRQTHAPVADPRRAISVRET
jgi:hypothetical protein